MSNHTQYLPTLVADRVMLVGPCVQPDRATPREVDTLEVSARLVRAPAYEGDSSHVAMVLHLVCGQVVRIRLGPADAAALGAQLTQGAAITGARVVK